MTSKIKALNEEEQSFEDDCDNEGRPSKEAQEELTLLKYKEALQTLARGRKRDAVELLEEIVSEEDIKLLSPPQQKLQLGCLKVLGDLYRDGECKDLERCKLMYERAIYFDQTGNNITFWYRLGKVCYEIGDLHSAYRAFAQTLSLRPSHWNSLEHIVTVSYAVHDYKKCMDYCLAGLSLDSGFYKGQVFLDLVLKLLPELGGEGKERVLKPGSCVPTQIPKDHQEVLKKKYLDELEQLMGRLCERSDTIRSQIVIPTPKIHFKFRMLTWSNLVRELLAAYDAISGTVEFHKPVEITWTLEDGVSNESDERQFTNDESQTEEDSQLGLCRSRSSSDDKDNNVVSADQETDSVDKTTGENGVEGQGTDGQNTQEAEGPGGNSKKKNRKDVKWWQMEGKRRSQRVRGHLMPVSPDKTKKESCFADQLKNLIAPSLLGDDGTSAERELVKATDKPGWAKTNRPAYFGTREEEVEVKSILGKLSGHTWSTVLSTVVQCLCNRVKFPWPNSLREMFLDLYSHVRLLVDYPVIETCTTSQLLEDCYACVCVVEVAIEKYKTDLCASDQQYCKVAVQAIYFLEECLQSSHPIPVDLMLRVKWMSVRRLLQLSLASNDDEMNTAVCSILAEIEAELRREPITVWTVNETANLICLDSVTEKSSGITKMQNSQTVTDLFQSEQYESVIGVLKTNVNFLDIEKRDLSDIYYYTVALYRTGNAECINHCVNVINQAIKFQDSTVLSDSLILFEEIWGKMSVQFSLQDKRSTVGCLLKILVAGERKPPSQESILTVPWCLLHSIMFSLEMDEPVLYLEEDTVPNSVLLLQMAHECMSRSEKCCLDGGKLLLYTMEQILKVKKRDEYFAHDETRLVMEQAIFCMYSHPSKKSKVKNLKDHNSVSSVITWDVCPTLYQYYCPDELPEFDTVMASSISAEVESLFQRFLEIMPQQLNPAERKDKIQKAISVGDETEELKSEDSFPGQIKDIYYLIADHHFKNKEWAKAITYYTWDLAVCWSRFDSWAAIALCMGEEINMRLNNADDIDFNQLLRDAQSTSYCFSQALKIQPSNIKLRIEFGSFVYAMHAYCSRLMKQQAFDIDMERFIIIEKAKEDFLSSSFKCFDVITKTPADVNDSTETVEEELWIHHYMLGKINEKVSTKEKAEMFLKQYEIAGKLLSDQGAPYPAKMNTYTPPELAIEALEIYYRVHASILNLVEICEYSFDMEKFFLKYIRHQENSPFMKNKQGKDGGDSKRGRKAAEDTISKKEMAEVTAVLNDLLDQTEKLVEANSAQSVTSSATSTTTTEDESSTDSMESSQPQVKSFSLTAFCERIREEEQRKAMPELKKQETANVTPSPVVEPETKESIYEGLDLATTHFYNDFKNVKFGGVVALCLRAMEECISRYPSHFKSYIRIAQTYLKFLKDPKVARDYLMGSPSLSQRKISGLFGDRKPTNFYNGIWRNPVDDLDRPGSFAYHMNKAMTLLLDVLAKLNDHQLLADIGIYLTKVPDNEKKYLSNTDRENLCSVAWNSSASAVKKITAESTDNFTDIGLEVYDTFLKYQKHYARGNLQIFSSCLHDLYKKFLLSQGYKDDQMNINASHAVSYFGQQYSSIKQNASRTNVKSSVVPNDGQKAVGDGAAPRKRGRRAARQASQETPPVALPSHDISAYEAAITAAFNTGMMEAQRNLSNQTLPLSYLKNLPPSGTAQSYPTMNIDPLKAVRNPVMNMKHIEHANKTAKTSVSAQDFSQSARMNAVPSSSQSLSKPLKPTSQDVPATKERAGSSASSKAKTPVSRAAKPDTGKDLAKYPPSPPVQPIRLNTSPYKAQATAVEKPPQFSYGKKSSGEMSSQVDACKDPPAAHSHTVPKRKRSEVVDSDVEIIDLTNKSPEKDGTTSERLNAGQPVKRKVLNLNPVTQACAPKPPVGKPSKSVTPKPVGRTLSSPKTNTNTPSPNPRPKVNITPNDAPAHRRESVISMVKSSENAPTSFSPHSTPVNPTTPVLSVKNRAPNPVSGNPSPTFVDLRAIANNPVPAGTTLRVTPNPGKPTQGTSPGVLGVKFSRANVETPKSAVPPSRGPKDISRVSVTLPQTVTLTEISRPVVSSPRAFVPLPRSSGDAPRQTVPKAAQSVESPRPPVLSPRPTTSNTNKTPTSSGTFYPLPPKKKHQMMYLNPPPQQPEVPDQNGDDVEVICLD